LENSAVKTKIAIACQGGGSQTAFTAGVLKALCEAHLQDEGELGLYNFDLVLRLAANAAPRMMPG
jgi:predicted acylesterase/phospholipase RssA